jgi:F420 biosynthesis protein FbiB-like protein
LVLQLLEEARWAPSPHNSQPWRFTVLFEREARDRLAIAMADRLAEELRRDGLGLPLIARQTERSRTRISAAPVVILCSLVREGLVEYPDGLRNRLEWQMAVQSVGAVLQTLFLVAWSRSIATCWMAAPMYCQDVVQSVLDLPVHFEPQALVLMGYPSAQARERGRKPISEVVDMR